MGFLLTLQTGSLEGAPDGEDWPSHQAVWGRDFGSVQTEWKFALNEDYSSFEVNKMTVWTEPLIPIKEATGVKKSIFGSLRPRSKGRRRPCCSHWNSSMHVSISCMRRAQPMPWLVYIGSIQANPLQQPNISTGVELKSFCPWCFKLGGNTKTIAIHARQVDYRMAIIWHICQVFACMSTQNILDHHSRCKIKWNNEQSECEGQEKAHKSHKKKKSKSGGQKGASR